MANSLLESLMRDWPMTDEQRQEFLARLKRSGYDIDRARPPGSTIDALYGAKLAAMVLAGQSDGGEVDGAD